MRHISLLLQQLITHHDHLCPRQVLGVRMGIYAGELLGIELPQTGKRLHAFVETDGCFVDGVAVATGCTPGHRTMRVMDYGKVAATFVDTETGRAIRIRPNLTVRERAAHYASAAPSRWHAQLEGYQIMPAVELLQAQDVRLTVSMEALISKPGMRVVCSDCGEEIMNEREVRVGNRTICRACAGDRYYEIDTEARSGMGTTPQIESRDGACSHRGGVE